MYYVRLDGRRDDNGVAQFRSIQEQVDWIMERLDARAPEPAPVAYSVPPPRAPRPPGPDNRYWRDIADEIVANMEREEAERSAQTQMATQQAEQPSYPLPQGGNRWPEGSYDVAGGPKYPITPGENAEGPHSSFRRNPPQAGPITNYETYWEQDPYTGEWQKKIRYRGTGKPHYDPPTKQRIDPPYIQERLDQPRPHTGTRRALPNEIPRLPGGGYSVTPRLK